MTVTQKVVGLNGDEAVALAVKQADVDVVAAYPITPQTIIVEKFSEYVHNGEVDTEFVCVESEHSALSACVTASAVGARTFTSTASAGLALMHEIVYITSSYRLPVVMAVVNRALSGPINIHCDHSDSMAERDAGWIQIYAENAQEAYDTAIQAFKIAEHADVQLPTMFMLDGFLISHTMQDIEVLSDEDVRGFLGKRVCVKTQSHTGDSVFYRLDPENPITIGPLALYDYYFECKRPQEESIRNSQHVIKEVNRSYGELSGRSYGDGLIDPYMLDDAEMAVVCLGSTAGTTRSAVRNLRANGVKAGLLRIRSYRPFPNPEVVKALQNVKAVAVLDRSVSFGGQGGPLFSEVRNAFYDASTHPYIVDYIYGLGGRDMPTSLIEKVFMNLQKIIETKRIEKLVQFAGLRE